jgi:non-ribosomal peptide synthetase component F
MLQLKGALQTTFEVQRVKHIANDPQTGKLRLVKVEHDQTRKPSGSIGNVTLKPAVRAGRIAPTNSLVRFQIETVEQSVPERFEKIVAQYAYYTAVKTKNVSLNYDALNKSANRLAHAILAFNRRGQ